MYSRNMSNDENLKERRAESYNIYIECKKNSLRTLPFLETRPGDLVMPDLFG